MSARMAEAFLRGFDELRHEPVQKRVRALVGDVVAEESTRAVLVYEPRYESPLRDPEDIADRVAFFNERVDLFLDGEPLERPLTPWS